MARAVSIIVIAAFVSLIYVHQYANLIECGYTINNSSRDLELLVDKNNDLRYGISVLESSARLDSKFKENIKGCAAMPLDSVTVKIKAPVAAEVTAGPVRLPIPVSGLFLSMFSFNNEAIAKEVSD
ncbi:MAG: hypothetical protein PHV77_07165 [Candidatus Omnitrophica bacterium]|jgi:hypothetical protein|nr:hypothetical protein [Candidatus Omnitrophota bacterium]